MGQQLGLLAAKQIAGLPVCCGERTDPGMIEVDEWHVWTALPSTEDQLRIERYLDGFAMSGARILHVGVGNSLLARRFCARGAEVVGTTIAPEEVAHGRAMGITRYDLRLHNKYRGHDGQAWGHFDFIVDNNPSSFACCLDHYMTMLKFYADVLKPAGQFLVDRVGLGWALSADGALARWGFSSEDLASTAALVDLRVEPVTTDILTVSRGEPARPSAIRRTAWRIIERLK